MSNISLIDEEEFMMEYEDSFDVIQDMLPRFTSGIQDSVSKCKSFLESSDASMLSEELHSLKGVVSNLYSPPLSQICVQMESEAKSSQLGEILPQLVEFEEKYPKALEQINQLLVKACS